MIKYRKKSGSLIQLIVCLKTRNMAVFVSCLSRACVLFVNLWSTFYDFMNNFYFLLLSKEVFTTNFMVTVRVLFRLHRINCIWKISDRKAWKVFFPILITINCHYLHLSVELTILFGLWMSSHRKWIRTVYFFSRLPASISFSFSNLNLCINESHGTDRIENLLLPILFFLVRWISSLFVRKSKFYDIVKCYK